MPSGTTSVGIGFGIARFAPLSDGMFCALLYCIERHEAAPIRIGFPFSAYNMGVLTPSTAAVFRQRGGIRRRGCTHARCGGLADFLGTVIKRLPQDGVQAPQ